MKKSPKSKGSPENELHVLHKKVAELEALAERQKRIGEKLRESEEKYHSITNATIAAIITMTGDGKISFWNPAAERIFGYSKEEITGKDLHFLLASGDYQGQFEKGISNFRNSGKGPLIGKMIELAAVRKDGTEFPIGLSLSAFQVNGQWNSIGILRDITEQKQAEKALKKARDELEERVKQRTAELQDTNAELERKALELAEANIALKILLQKNSEAIARIEEKIMGNLDQLVIPYLDELAMKFANKNDGTLINIIKTNLEQITSSFTQRLSVKFTSLSPREIQIANLIRQGWSTKEMAGLLSVSRYTVETYRASIREKFGIKNKKVNLISYLQSFR
jgi:PAS domain S-box-containing protein